MSWVFWTNRVCSERCWVSIRKQVQITALCPRSVWLKKLRLIVLITSDVILKKHKRPVYTLPKLVARICKVNLSNTKKSAFFFFFLGLPCRQRSTSYKLQPVTDWLPPRTIVSYNRPLFKQYTTLPIGLPAWKPTWDVGRTREKLVNHSFTSFSKIEK